MRNPPYINWENERLSLDIRLFPLNYAIQYMVIQTQMKVFSLVDTQGLVWKRLKPQDKPELSNAIDY